MWIDWQANLHCIIYLYMIMYKACFSLKAEPRNSTSHAWKEMWHPTVNNMDLIKWMILHNNLKCNYMDLHSFPDSLHQNSWKKQNQWYPIFFLISLVASKHEHVRRKQCQHVGTYWMLYDSPSNLWSLTDSNVNCMSTEKHDYKTFHLSQNAEEEIQ